MSIIVRCTCGKQVSAPDDKAGKKGRCPHCQAVLLLPSPAQDVRDPMAPVVRPIPPQKKWYVQAKDGRTFGPVAHEQLDTWFAERRITAGCFLWQDGDKQMRYASDVYPQLADIAADDMPEIVTTTKSVVSRGAPDASEGGGGMNEMESFRCLGKKLIASSEYGAVTDYNQARLLHATTPNVSNAWTHVVPVLAKYGNCEGKRSLFGHDKGEIAYRDLEEKLHLVVLGLYGDGLVSQGASTDECLLAVLRSLVSFVSVRRITYSGRAGVSSTGAAWTTEAARDKATAGGDARV